MKIDWFVPYRLNDKYVSVWILVLNLKSFLKTLHIHKQYAFSHIPRLLI